MVQDVAIAPGLDAAGPLIGEEAMYIPAAQMDAQLLSQAPGSNQVGLPAQPARWKG